MSARDAILAKLRAAPKQNLAPAATTAYYQDNVPQWDALGRLRHWARTMRAVNTEIVWVHAHDWAEQLQACLQQKGLRHLLLAKASAHGAEAAAQLAAHAPDICVTDYSRDIDDWKAELFTHIDCGFTDVRAGIAQTGTLVLWPDAIQPRSMSLVPHTHIALFDTLSLHDRFIDAMQALDMATGMPTNVVLVSGPSKTADIQMTLAYGAHGPKNLIVLALLPDGIDSCSLEETQP
ncbi:MAG: lactate utilization protein [Neisseriaceae bacterium]|nr:lactate utilization protein [Neisseriaceae bacterium]